MDTAGSLRVVVTEEADAPPRTMWHITLTVAGSRVTEPAIRAALERLSHEHPFLLSGRYAADRAEVRYWEEAADVASALRMAVLLWDEHVVSAQLPSWRVVGVEVVDRDTFHRRGRHIHEQPSLVATGRVIPF
jgi:hypothetical protein